MRQYIAMGSDRRTIDKEFKTISWNKREALKDDTTPTSYETQTPSASQSVKSKVKFLKSLRCRVGGEKKHQNLADKTKQRGSNYHLDMTTKLTFEALVQVTANRKLKQPRRLRQIKLRSKMNIYSMATTLQLLLFAHILYCWQIALQVHC